MVRGGFMIRGRLVVGRRLVVRGRFLVGLWGISILSSTMYGVFVVARSQVFVEDGTVRAVEGVLLTVSMAEMVNRASGFWVCVVPVGIGSLSAIKRGVTLMNRDRNGLDFFHFIRSLFEKNGLLGFVRGLISRLGGVVRRRGIRIDWFVGGLGRMIRRRGVGIRLIGGRLVGRGVGSRCWQRMVSVGA